MANQSQLSRLKRMIKTLPRHPIFEIAEQTPVFVLSEQVYSVGDGRASDGEDLFEKKRKTKVVKKPLIKVGDFASLDDLVFDRANPDMAGISKYYVQGVQKDLAVLKRLNKSMDTPQLIFKQVFSYLQDGEYKDKVTKLLEVKSKERVAKRNQRTSKLTSKLEKIAGEVVSEVNDLISQIEQEGKSGESGKRSSKQRKLDELFKYQPARAYTGSSLFGRAINGKNIAIVDGVIYNVILSNGAQHDYKLQVGKRKFGVFGNGNGKIKDLEERFLVELGKKVRIDALREHLSRDKIIDLLRTQDAELLAMAGRKEYQGEGFGFTQDEKGSYYAYLDFPAMAIKSEVDENYYLYDKTKIALRVSKNKGNLDWDRDFFMVDNNGHPYVHNKNQRFAKICQGDATYSMPTSGKDVGEVIVKRLRKMKEVLMFGYTWRFFDPAYEGDNYGKNYTSHRRDLSELQKMNIPIIVKGEIKNDSR